jgi:hypothetical protein
MEHMDSAEIAWMMAAAAHSSALTIAYNEILSDRKMAARWVKVQDAIEQAAKAAYDDALAGFIRRKAHNIARLAVDDLKARLEVQDAATTPTPSQAGGHSEGATA